MFKESWEKLVALKYAKFHKSEVIDIKPLKIKRV